MTVRAQTQTTSLGRYRVVRRLANGGMADVLLARTEGIEGFSRHVVIKRIHPELLDEPRYVTMFLDEARLAASLHHHNIVQVNDIGVEDGEYFFAMEYVHGEDARTLLVEASKRKQQIPLQHVIAIVAGAAAGLHHAHEQVGPDRAPLGIVHRDVSPANLLVGFDGCVKVADFGIALAAHRAEQTQSGVLKGKVAYMSPEQCNCERVDRRSDVFSLGICLYELATVRPCFAGANDFMTMSAIVAGKLTPPSQVAPGVDLALQAIILKALAPRPADRFQTADDLRLALEAYADAAGLRTSTTALADYMKQQFGERALPWQDVSSPPDHVDEPEIEIVPVSRSRSVKQTLPLRTKVPRAERRTPFERALGLHTAQHPSTEHPPVEPVGAVEIEPVAPARRRWWIFVLLALALAVAATLLVLSRSSQARSPERPASRPVSPPAAAPSHLEAPKLEVVPTPAAPPLAGGEPTQDATTTRPAPTKKQAPTSSAKKPRPTQWDPDALFPP